MASQLTNRRLIALGAFLGFGFGIWNLLHSLLFPLADDSIAALLMFYGPMFTIWGVAAFVASRETARVIDGIKAAVIVAVVTGIVFDVMVLLRVNVFLNALTERADWQNLMMQFRASGSDDLRTFINSHYVMQAPVKILVGATIGFCTGLIGGIVGTHSRRGFRSA
jgi:hypothetical protein